MNIALTHTAEECPPRRRFTAKDIGRMIDAGVLGEKEPIELIEGDIVVMAAKGYAHELIKNAISIAVARALPVGMTMGVEMTVQFGDATILEPDVSVFKKSSLIKSDANFCQIASGELLLAIEVASSSLGYDKGLKAQLYARHRVQEFWVIDANARKTWVHTGPSGDGWSSIVERDPNQTLTTPALAGFVLKLADID
ncbi:MAG: hypothetical protein QOI12_4554 [Alphaproteobacteria bacterium]|jgi:Uma2 family endonuclease|nr:hypothetical protein [Alphaproteobacteria bacterium]